MIGSAVSEPEPLSLFIFAARRAAQQQRHLAIGDRLLRQIVIDDQREHAVVAELLALRAAGIGREELQRRRVRRGRGDDDRLAHRAVLGQRADELGDGRALLAERDIDAVELGALVAALVRVLLVDEGVDRDGRLAGLAIADDQLALAAADGDERVDRLEAGLYRLVHRGARDDARGLHFDARTLGGDDRALAVDRDAEAVDHAAEQALADRHVDDGVGALDDVAFLDLGVRAEDHDADIVGLEVERHALHAIGELDHLAGLDVVQPVDAGDAVTDRQHLAGFRDLGLGAERCDLVHDDLRDFSGADIHCLSLQPFIACASVFSRVRIDESIICEPILTTRPPSREGSTERSTVTSRRSRVLSCAFNSSTCAALSGCAEVTSAVVSPRWAAASWRKARMIWGSCDRRRFCASTPRNFVVIASSFIDAATAATALAAASRLSSGLAISRWNSGDWSTAARTATRLASTAGNAFSSRASSNSAVA